MENQALLQMFNFSRSNTLAGLKATTEEQALQVPEGFNNSILWNLGHVYLAVEGIMARLDKKDPEVPEEYNDFFGHATSPSTWEKEPPALTELADDLESQIERVEMLYGDKLDEKLAEPFKLNERTVFETYGEVLNFMIWHEGYHLGTINGIKRAIGIKDLWQPLETQESK
ncbi:DinB family protein [Pseudalkalibacillus berkeleyi]|uniref:DinB family protein n=1 Tax=Pseudalkalibacillus berkeleyi TaxID=1069813 RepID=A0ABS9GWU3_9BACL|nr:DinB family protein [Pseudalkalibacillus berkeleyi]MCF6136291.1 DinB family protein [Pseudalkalibacillus berkeleyi]